MKLIAKIANIIQIIIITIPTFMMALTDPS
jgi:hypothetical protein